MKNKAHRPLVLATPSENDIRDYAYHLFEQGDRAPGHELAHWFEATAILNGSIPPHRNGVHHQPPIREMDRHELSIDS